MTRLERDHPRLRALREGEAPSILRQYVCGVCGTSFLLSASIVRHAKDHAADLAARQAAYEASRGPPGPGHFRGVGGRS